MDDVISRQALLEALYDNEFQCFCPLDEVSTVIDGQPAINTADLRPRGRWTEDGQCPLCGAYDNADPYGSNFCHHCGADMREETP